MSRTKTCTCGKEIAFLKTKKGKFVPVTTDRLTESELNDLENGFGERLFDFKKHIAHFTDCPDRDKYRKAK